MYQGTTGARAEQWQQACDFYEEDLKSGFVRLLMELMGASFHDDELRREFVPRMLALAPPGRGGGERVHRRLGARAAGVGRGHLGLDRLVLDRHGGQHDAWHRREGTGHQREALDAVATLLRQRRSGDKARPAEARRKRRIDRAPAARGSRSTAGPLPAPGTLPAPYPYETIAPVTEGFVERDGVRSWYAQYGESGPVARVRAGLPDRQHAPAEGRRALARAALPRRRRATCAATAAPTGRPIAGSSIRSSTTTPTSSPSSTGSRSTARRSSRISAATMTALRLAAEQPERGLASRRRRRLSRRG